MNPAQVGKRIVMRICVLSVNRLSNEIYVTSKKTPSGTPASLHVGWVQPESAGQENGLCRPKTCFGRRGGMLVYPVYKTTSIILEIIPRIRVSLQDISFQAMAHLVEMV
jgi:hypothetical protein